MKKVLLLLGLLLSSPFLAIHAQTDYALQLNGTTGYVEADEITPLLVNTDFTWEFWFKLNADATTWNALAVVNQSDKQNRLETGVSSEEKFYVYTPFPSATTVQGSTVLNVGQWYHVAIVFDYDAGAGQITVYLNGQPELNLVNLSINPQNFIEATDLFSLGQEWDDDGPSAFFNGEIDEFRVWNDQRTQAEILANRFVYLQGNEANLVHYQPMNDGSGTASTDITSNTNPGTLIGGVTWITSTRPGPYSGGDGTANNPYQIATTDDLLYLSLHPYDWSKHFLQTANLTFNADETQVDWNQDGTPAFGNGFSPIGNMTTKFTGNYDGNGYSISNLSIENNTPTSTLLGLFGMTNGATIDQVHLVDAFVSSTYYDPIDPEGSSLIGSLIGSAVGTQVTNCLSEGLYVRGWERVGGLIGNASGSTSISNTQAEGQVLLLNATSENAGGLLGFASMTTITSSAAKVNVQGAGGQYVGGFVGNLQTGSLCSKSWANGNVSGDFGVGGFAGLAENSVVSESTALGTVTGSRRTGGFVGYLRFSSSNTGVLNSYATGAVVRSSGSDVEFGAFCGLNWDASITNSYATGTITYTGGTDPSDKGFVGAEVDSPSYADNYFNTDLSNQSSATGASALSSEQMRSQGNFTDWNFTPVSGQWSIHTANYLSFPYLQSLTYDVPGASPAVIPIPGLLAVDAPSSITPSAASTCPGQTITLTANGVQGTVNWYTASCSGTLLGTGNTINITSTETATYYAKNEVNGVYSASCASIQITVNPLLVYRSVATGNWNLAANWEQLENDGTTWSAAATYPGQVSNSCQNHVLIQSSTEINIPSGVNITIPNLQVGANAKLTIQSGGKIYVEDQLELDSQNGAAIVVE